MNEDGQPITERKRLEASAVVAAGVSRTTSKEAVSKERVRSLVRDGVLGLLVVIVIVLGIRVSSEGSRTRDAVTKGNQVNCQLFKDAGSTETNDQTTIVGLKLLADFRNSYFRNDCQDVYGKLAPADKRILPYLDKDAR